MSKLADLLIEGVKALAKALGHKRRKRRSKLRKEISKWTK